MSKCSSTNFSSSKKKSSLWTGNICKIFFFRTNRTLMYRSQNNLLHVNNRFFYLYFMSLHYIYTFLLNNKKFTHRILFYFPTFQSILSILTHSWHMWKVLKLWMFYDSGTEMKIINVIFFVSLKLKGIFVACNHVLLWGDFIFVWLPYLLLFL